MKDACGIEGGGIEVRRLTGGACLIDRSEPNRKCCTTGNLAISYKQNKIHELPMKQKTVKTCK